MYLIQSTSQITVLDKVLDYSCRDIGMAEQNSQIENIAKIDSHLDYQAVIIGGVAGIYQIKRLADLGVRPWFLMQ